MPEPTEVRDELTTTRRIITALDKLDPRAQRRIVDYITDRYAPLDPPIIHMGGPDPEWAKTLRGELDKIAKAERGPR